MSYVLCNRTSSTSQGNNSLHFQRADGRRRHTDGCQDTTGRVTAHDNSVTATQTFCHFSGNHIITSWSLNSPSASLWIQLKYAHPFGDNFKNEFVLLDLNFHSLNYWIYYGLLLEKWITSYGLLLVHVRKNVQILLNS